MRFIALRCKDTIAPTGTLAQGVGAKQVNSLGDVYEDKYGLTTSQRVWGTVAENRAGRGPCYLKTEGITKEQSHDLEKAYLNMAPSQTLKWVAGGKGADEENVEIEGTEPYIVGGHTASGYWIDNHRKTTLDGLYAAGDVAGGCPQKYVTGALAEGKIAGLSAMDSIGDVQNETIPEALIQQVQREAEQYLSRSGDVTAEKLEAQMQEIMDQYAGGISTYYAFTEDSLAIAEEKIKELIEIAKSASVSDMQDLTHFLEVRERLTVCLSVIAHLKARKETRWHCFAENESYPNQDDEHFLQYVNSKVVDGEIQIIMRPLAERRGSYEYQN
jgi:adenylylsulfate reductase subunit A